MENQIFNEPRCRIYWIDGNKFKTQICTIFFQLKLNRENVTKTALLAEVLKQGCNRYPTPRDLAIQSEEMFGGWWDIQVVQKGEVQLLSFTLETVKCVDMLEVLNFLMELINNPLVDNDEFNKNVVDKQKKILENNLLAQKDNKKYYAKSRCLQETGKSTPLGIDLNGYVEDINEITPKILYNYFEDIRENMPVKIFFCGDERDKKEVANVRRKFTQTKEFPKEDCVTKSVLNEVNSKAKYINEKGDIEQSRVLISFETSATYGKKTYATLLLLAQILGGGGNSILFHRIREEKGLCYEIKAYNYPLTQYLFIETGVDPSNKKDVYLEVMEIVEKMKTDQVEPATLDEAKREIRRQYEMILDNPWAMIDFFIDEIIWGKDRDLQGFLRQIDYVTSADIMKMVKKIKLKILYTLDNNGN